jgi:hypothetical protein
LSGWNLVSADSHIQMMLATSSMQQCQSNGSVLPKIVDIMEEDFENLSEKDKCLYVCPALLLPHLYGSAPV